MMKGVKSEEYSKSQKIETDMIRKFLNHTIYSKVMKREKAKVKGRNRDNPAK